MTNATTNTTRTTEQYLAGQSAAIGGKSCPFTGGDFFDGYWDTIKALQVEKYAKFLKSLTDDELKCHHESLVSDQYAANNNFHFDAERNESIVDSLRQVAHEIDNRLK